jgi:hypothetical protein
MPPSTAYKIILTIMLIQNQNFYREVEKAGDLSDAGL